MERKDEDEPMSTLRIRKTIDSETLHLPELKPLIGRTVEITISEDPDPATRDEFYEKAGHIPDSEAEWAEQQATFRTWGVDLRFERFWPIIERLLAIDFAATRRWATAARAAQELGETGYDFDAWREQRDYDLKHANDHLP